MRPFSLALLVLLLASVSSEGQVILVGSSGGDYGNAVAHDSAGNIFFCGWFEGTVDFDPSDGPDSLDTLSAGSSDYGSFIASYEPEGDFRFAFSITGSGYVETLNIAVDPDGNILVGGYVEGTVDFDPGAGITNLTGDSSYNLFLAKYSSTGALVFAKQSQGTGDLYPDDMITDPSGNVYFAGYLDGTEDFDPSSAVQNVSSSDGLFVVSYDNSGVFRFARTFESDDTVYAYDIAVDSAGNSYVCGSIWGTVDFDSSNGPDPGVDTFTAHSSGDGFLVSFGPAGSFRFGQILGGTASDRTAGVAVDGSDHIYVTGMSNGGADFDPGPGVVDPNPGATSFYLASYTSSGALRFANGEDPVDRIGSGIGEVIATRGSDIFVAGNFGGLIAIGNGDGDGYLKGDGSSGSSAGAAFVAKYTDNGSLTWALDLDFDDPDAYSIELSVAPDGSVALTGSLEGSAEFDPSIDDDTRTSAGGSIDAYLLPLSPSGYYPGGTEPSFEVTNTNDSGAGSLRRALEHAGNTAAPDTINFNLPGGGPHVISPLTPLPMLLFPIEIDGLSQSGADASSWPPDLRIVLDGSSAPAGTDGLSLGDNGTGLGHNELPSWVKGLVIRNFDGDGIQLNLSAQRYRISDCFIGTSVDGMSAAGNGGAGVNNESFSGAGSASRADQAHFIGLPPDATFGRNLISGNGAEGIAIIRAGWDKVRNNFIGVAADGTTPLPNGSHGVLVSSPIDQEPEWVSIGGEEPGSANVIAHNTGAGVAIGDALRIEVLGNSITGNGGLGIDHFLPPSIQLGAVWPNSIGNSGSRPNRPELAWAMVSGAETVVCGILDGTPGAIFRLEFFSDSSPDASGAGEGAVFLGFTEVDTRNGSASFKVSLPVLPAGHWLSATATRVRKTSGDVDRRDTSEFSYAVEVTLPTVTSVADSGTGSLRTALADANASPGAEVVYISPTLAGATLSLASPLPLITNDLRIVAPCEFKISGGGASRVLEVNAPGATVTLEDLTLTDGFTASDGGAVLLSAGTLELRRCIVSGSRAGGHGGGIAVNGGLLDMQDTRLTDNEASGDGGGIARLDGELNAYRVTLDHNRAGGKGGGLYTAAAGVRDFLRSVTFSANRAVTGGGIHDEGSLPSTELEFCTLTGNEATSDGGGAYGPIYCIYSIISLNTAPANPEESGNFAIYDSTVGGDPLLGPLRDNGGHVPTHALLTGSPAIDAESVPSGASLTTDARLAPRVRGSRVDQGAFEYHGGSTGQYANWASLQGGGLGGPEDDPNGDGIKNLAAYFFGVSPFMEGLPLAGVRGRLEDGNFVMSYSTPLSVSGVTSTPQVATGLPDGWSPGPNAVEVGSSTVRIYYEVTIPLASPSLFGRLNLTLP